VAANPAGLFDRILHPLWNSAQRLPGVYTGQEQCGDWTTGGFTD